MYLYVQIEDNLVVETSSEEPDETTTLPDNIKVVEIPDRTVPPIFGTHRLFYENDQLVLKDIASLQSQIERAIQLVLDRKAGEYGYDGIISACSYAGYDNPYQAEGQAFLQWRGSVWQYCYDQLGEIEAGNRDEPTVEDFIAELPEYQPPQQ